MHICAWQSADRRVTTDQCRVTFRWVFTKSFQIVWNVQNVVWQSADGRVTSDHCRVTVQRLFSKIFLIAWNVQKRCLTVGRRSRDLNHCRVTVQRLFSKFSQIAWNVQKTLFDSRPTVAWPPTTVAWPFSHFFQNSPKSFETSKNAVWQSADGRVTSDHCRVTVQRLFSKFSQLLETSKKRCLTVGRRSRDPPTTVAWPFSDFFSKKFLIAWNVEKSLFDSRPTAAWPPTTVAWPLSDFFQNFPKSLETSKKRCLTVSRRSRDLRPLSRDRSATFFKFSQIAWNVQKTLFDSRPTVAWPPTTVAWPFSDFFQKFF